MSTAVRHPPRDLECGTVQPCLAEERRAGAIDERGSSTGSLLQRCKCCSFQCSGDSGQWTCVQPCTQINLTRQYLGFSDVIL